MLHVFLGFSLSSTDFGRLGEESTRRENNMVVWGDHNPISPFFLSCFAQLCKLKSSGRTKYTYPINCPYDSHWLFLLLIMKKLHLLSYDDIHAFEICR